MNHRLTRHAGLLGSFLLLTAAAAAHAQPALVISDVTVTEPSSGTGVATFTVSYTDGQPHGPTIFFVTTVSGPPINATVATGGAGCGGNVDYVNINNYGHTFTAVSYTFTVTICADAHDEADQQFLVNITARGVTVQDGQAIATIVDDDPTPSLSISDVRVAEGPNGATVDASLTLTLTGATERAPTVSFATANGSALTGACSAGADFEPASGSISFTRLAINAPPPTQQQVILVRVCGDDISEGDQQFDVRLANSTHATIADAVALVTITDDEPLPTLSITPQVVVSEPNAVVPQSQAAFNVTLAGPATEQPVSVNYTTSPGTASGASTCAVSANGHAPGDFVSQAGTLTFSPGKNPQQIQVPICADSVTGELNETFSVTLVRATNARITQAQGTATIR